MRRVRTRRSPHDPSVAVTRSSYRLKARNLATATLEAELAQLLRVPLPVLGDLHVQVEVDPGAEQRLDLPARVGTDLAQPLAALADHDALLAGPLDVEVGVHVEQVVAAFPRHHLL